jgi:integrase
MADEQASRARLASGEGLFPRCSDTPTFTEFWSRWFVNHVEANNGPAEVLKKRSAFERLLQPTFGKMNLDDISTGDVNGFIAAMRKRGLKAKTINTLLSHLRKCLSDAADEDLLDRLPKIKRLPIEKPLGDFLSEDEMKTLVERAPGAPKGVMVVLAVLTGMRRGELRGLRWEDVDLRNRVIKVARNVVLERHVKLPKSGKARVIPLAEHAATLLEQQNHFETGWVFPGKNGHPLRPDECRTIVATACDVAGVRRVGWHALRHTFATQLALRGVPGRVIQEYMGHSTIAMTEHYLHYANKVHHSAVETLMSAPVGPSWSVYGQRDQVYAA